MSDVDARVPQADWHDRLRQEGFKVVITYGAHETIEAIKAYLDQA